MGVRVAEEAFGALCLTRFIRFSFITGQCSIVDRWSKTYTAFPCSLKSVIYRWRGEFDLPNSRAWATFFWQRSRSCRSVKKLDKQGSAILKRL